MLGHVLVLFAFPDSRVQNDAIKMVLSISTLTSIGVSALPPQIARSRNSSEGAYVSGFRGGHTKICGLCTQDPNPPTP